MSESHWIMGTFSVAPNKSKGAFEGVKSSENDQWKTSKQIIFQKINNSLFVGNPLTEQSFTGRSGLQKLKKWMGFCVLKASNSFFQLSWKEKTCLLSAANIECKNFEQEILFCTYKAFFGVFYPFLRKSLREPENP